MKKEYPQVRSAHADQLQNWFMRASQCCETLELGQLERSFIGPPAHNSGQDNEIRNKEGGSEPAMTVL